MKTTVPAFERVFDGASASFIGFDIVNGFLNRCRAVSIDKGSGSPHERANDHDDQRINIWLR
jgi:hypothetical protein